MRSDVFSFCVALYEALAGVRPFAGRSRKELLDAIDGGKLQPGEIDSVPRELRRALAQGLRAAPDERPTSMSTLLSSLSREPAPWRRRLSGAVAISTMRGSPTSATRSRRRRLLVTVLIGAAAAALTGHLVARWMY